MIPFDSLAFFNQPQYFDRGIYLNGGTFEPMLNGEEDFARMLNERLGLDAEITFKAIVYENKHEYEEGDDYELIADEYLQELMSAADEVESARDNLRDILDADRLSRKELEILYQDLKRLAHNIRFNT